MKWLSLAAASALLVSGCAVAVYPGPKRPATETARIVARGESSVRSIDGLELPIGSEFTVLPGLHAITMGSGFAAPKTSCFKAQAGHSYSVALEGVNHEATISVTDVGADAMARAIEVALGGTCAAVAAQWDPPPRPAPRPVAPAPAAREEAPVVAAADDDGEDDGEDQPPAAPAKPAPPPARAPMAVDFETLPVLRARPLAPGFRDRPMKRKTPSGRVTRATGRSSSSAPSWAGPISRARMTRMATWSGRSAGAPAWCWASAGCGPRSGPATARGSASAARRA